MEESITPEMILDAAEKLLRQRGDLSIPFRFHIDKTLREEEYSISREEGLLTIAGGTASAVMFGVGRLIREPAFSDCSAPAKSFRGIYFATHFGNWYDNAPLEEIDLYLEDLVIWGCNTVKVWFDRHQYKNIQEKAAQEKIKRLKYILKRAALLGMKSFLLVLANEAYKESPGELRADWIGLKNGYRTKVIGGHYHVELCPSKPEALALLLAWHEEVLEAFSDTPIHYFEIFSYDQGGCTCADCAPYGANGYWKIIPPLSRLVRRKKPGCRIVLSTWRFDRFTTGEWEFLRNNTELLRKHADILSVDNGDLENLKTLPGDIPAIGFTDISMGGQLPWGGFGVNPCPAFLETFRKDPGLLGSSAYSEGIYEDLNKIILLGTEWDAGNTAVEMIGKYTDFYFGKAVREMVTEAVLLMEENLSHDAVILQNTGEYSAYAADDTDPDSPWELHYKTPHLDKGKARKCMALIKDAERLMEEETKRSWRWQIICLKAETDLALAQGTVPEEAFLKLEKIYHCGSNTLPCLIPPSHKSWSTLIAGKRPSLV